MTAKCTQCHHLSSVHRMSLSNKVDGSKLYTTTIRCTAALDDGSDCDCFVQWFSYAAVLKPIGDVSAPTGE
jgi:hypothetical protein